jgi:hypothetical protein
LSNKLSPARKKIVHTLEVPRDDCTLPRVHGGDEFDQPRYGRMIGVR